MTKRTCTFTGCPKPLKAKDLCSGHWAQQNQGKPLTPLRPTRPRSTDPTEWFLSWFDTSGGPDSCHEWQRGCSNEYGYSGSEPLVALYGTPEVHVIKWIIANGPIPDKLFVCHICDNPPCGNVRHLFLGTHRENVADMVAKKRHPHGETNGGAKLVESQAVEILRRLKNGETQTSIAAMYGVSQGQISRIKLGKSWSHLTP